MIKCNKILTTEESEKLREEFFSGSQWTSEQVKEMERRRVEYLILARENHYKKWNRIFTGCILWQTAVALTYGMKYFHLLHACSTVLK